MSIQYEKLIVAERVKPSTIKDRNISEETSSDRSRAIFCSSFRRLQQKAQVFSLETNSTVRSRLSHSLEVSNYGKLIAQKITSNLRTNNTIGEEFVIPFINIVDTSCLLHDIGNPPFGHFGEAAIRKWFIDNWKKSFKCAIEGKVELKNNDFFENALLNDFFEFDGNPQGFRIITYIQDPYEDFTGQGMNLTLSQIYCFLKYLKTPDGKKGSGIYKKPGYFHSEMHIVDRLKNYFKKDNRYPLTYIMEAADDISYCISDIEDGIEKNIIDSNTFFKEFKKEWNIISEGIELPQKMEEIINNDSKDAFFNFKISFSNHLIDKAYEAYVSNHDECLIGERSQLLDKNSCENLILETLKNVSRKILFRSKEAEDKELAGYTIIIGLLDKLSPLLNISNNKFAKLIESVEDPKVLYGMSLDVEWRLFNRLPKKYVKAYKYSLENHIFTECTSAQNEWFYRAHLIVDFISGMTDNFALELYKLLHGIEINK